MTEHTFTETVSGILFPENIILKSIMFFTFGTITSLPYLFANLSTIAKGEIISYVRLVGKGYLVGLSTIYNNLLNIQQIISGRMFSSILLTLFLLIFSGMTLYQFADLGIRITDVGKNFPPIAIGVFSILFIIVLSPLASYIIEGETLASNQQETQNQQPPPIEQPTENIPTFRIPYGGDFA